MLTRKASDGLVARVKERAKKDYGFSEDDLRRSDLRGFTRKTQSSRILRLIQMAHYRGKLNGLFLVWSELGQPFEVRNEEDMFQPHPAMSRDDLRRWSHMVREDALRDGFDEAALNRGRNFSAYTRSSRVMRLCNLAYSRGEMSGVRFAEKMSRAWYRRLAS